MTNYKPIDEKTIEDCRKSLGDSNQKRSVFDYILKHPDSFTHSIARGAGAINVPRVVKAIRPALIKHGVKIVNYLPAQKKKTRHGHTSQLNQWRLETVDKKNATSSQ